MLDGGFPLNAAIGSGGLGAYATRDIRAGEVILVERPLVLTVAHGSRDHFCAVCLADSRCMHPAASSWSQCCVECRLHFYCSQRCAKADAARHSGIECEALKATSAESLEEDDIDTVAQAIRILADRANGVIVDVGVAGKVGPHSYAERLVGITPTTDEARTALQRIAACTLKALPERARIPPAELLDLLERHSCNLYGVSGKAGEDVAAASFCGFFHLLNHACCPNVVFDSAHHAMPATVDGAPPAFALRSLEDVAEGAELRISYTSSADGPAQRSEHLREYYGFECACERCACDDMLRELDYSDKLDALRCALEECGSGLGVPDSSSATDGGSLLRCVHCGEVWEADVD